MFEWRVKTFSELSVYELYECLRLRVDVFIVEQQAPYRDLDGKDVDPETRHVMGFDGDKLVAYSRLMAQGLGYPQRCNSLLRPTIRTCVSVVSSLRKVTAERVSGTISWH